MLFSQQRGGYQYRYLSAIGDGNKGRPQRNLSLAETYVTADQTIHGLGRTQILDYRINGRSLIGCFLEAESFDKGLVVMLSEAECMACTGGTLSIKIQQFRR